MMKHKLSKLFFSAAFVLMATGFLAQMSRRPLAAEEKPVTITLTAVPVLQFDLPRFVVKPGAKVKVVLKNADDMSHNLVFTKPGSRAAVVDAASKLEENGPAMNYIPDSPDVLWTIAVISPGEEGTVSFTAPDKPGVYPYVCTFPGHGYYMYGAMYVSSDDKLPAIEKDVNVPPARQRAQGDHAGHETSMSRNHPYDLMPPYLYRAYMEDSGPASIAVHLPQRLSYCWDTDACALRYAWEGDFIDNTGLWKGKPNAVARVLGTVFYRSEVDRQLRIGSNKPTTMSDFKGYRLINRYPEFHYTVEGVDVYELIEPKDDGSGLIRTFRIPEAKKDIWFPAPEGDGVAYECAVGKSGNNMIMIPAEHAGNFRIVMSKKAK